MCLYFHSWHLGKTSRRDDISNIVKNSLTSRVIAHGYNCKGTSSKTLSLLKIKDPQHNIASFNMFISRLQNDVMNNNAIIISDEKWDILLLCMYMYIHTYKTMSYFIRKVCRKHRIVKLWIFS